MTASEFKALRKHAGTQASVAAELGVTRPMLQAAETKPAHRHRRLLALAIRCLLYDRAQPQQKP